MSHVCSIAEIKKEFHCEVVGLSSKHNYNICIIEVLKPHHISNGYNLVWLPKSLENQQTFSYSIGIIEHIPHKAHTL